EIAGDEVARAIDEKAAIRIAVPGDSDVGAVVDDPFDDVAAVLLDERGRLVIGGGAVNLGTEARRLARETNEEPRGDASRHPAARVEYDVDWLYDLRIDERQHVPDVVVQHIHRRQ